LATINATEQPGQGAASAEAAETNGRAAEANYSSSSSSQATPARLKAVYDRMLEIDAEGAPARAASILAGLSFDEAMQRRATKTFSGGVLSSLSSMI
jgi:ATP-binding cassette subfamily F protein 3